MDDIERARQHANGGGPAPEVAAQVVITLFKNNTTNLSYTADEMTTRALLDKGRSILDFQSQEIMREAASKIAKPAPGDARRFGLS